MAGVENHITRIAIIGGGGRVGRHILAALVAKGTFSITAIQRPDSTSSVRGDLRVIRAEYSDEDESDLVKALRGQQALIITMAVTAPPDTIAKIARAAAKAGVSYVLPNWFGHDSGNEELCRDSLLAARRDEIVNEFKQFAGRGGGGNTAYIFLVCNFWYEFSLAGGPDRFGFDFARRSLVLFDAGDVKINTTTWPQCGRAIANLFSLKDLPDGTTSSPTVSQFANKPVYISSFRVSQRDIFDSVKRVTGTTDADWTLSHEPSRRRWEAALADVKTGNFSAFTKMLYSRMFFPTGGDGDYESRRGTDNELLQLPAEDLDYWTGIAVRLGEDGAAVATHH